MRIAKAYDGAGLRNIPFGEGVIRALCGWRSVTAYPNPNDLVFPRFKGEYRSHDGMIKSK